jgi:hypothetical protein
LTAYKFCIIVERMNDASSIHSRYIVAQMYPKTEFVEHKTEASLVHKIKGFSNWENLTDTTLEHPIITLVFERT